MTTTGRSLEERTQDGGVRIRFLGKPALFVGDSLQLFGGPRKAIALLAYLLLHRDRPLLRAAIAEQFWPDEEDEQARAALRRHLHRALAAIPNALPERPWVLADRTTLRWNPLAPLELDTSEYERLSRNGERAAAVELYHGDYLEDFYDEWVLVERERLRNLHSASLIALIDERRRDLDFRNAIDYAQALLRMDGLHEDAVRRLMSLRFASGDKSGALADFESFSRRIRDELAAEPMPETIALREAIRRDDTAAADRTVTQQAKAPPGLPFVGREDALRTIRRAWERSVRGSGAAVLISGEAGIGKTRLIGELIASAEAQGGRIALGTTSVTETEPYQPVAEAFRAALPLIRFAELEPMKLAALSSMFSEIREFAPDLVSVPLTENARERHRLFDAIGTTFAQVAAKRPLLAVFEDVHWASAATIELLDFLVRRLCDVPALMVFSVREESLDRNLAIAAFLRRLDPRYFNHVGLGALSVEDVRLLAAHAADGSETFAHDLCERTGGNPLFLTEVLREQLGGATPGSVPRSIGTMVEGRVARLSDSARTLLETAAVIGEGFDSDAVRRILGWTFERCFDALDELLDGALIRESPRRRGDFLFSHQLVHAAVYDALPASELQRLHRRVGRTLQRLFANRPSVYAAIARHYDRAGMHVDAVGHYILAARHAVAVFSHEEAIALTTRGLEIASGARECFDLHCLREEAAAHLGNTTLQENDCLALRAVAAGLDDDDLLGLALCRSIELAKNFGKRDEEDRWISLLREHAERTTSPTWALEATLAEARYAVHAGDAIRAEAILARAEPVARTVADDRLAVHYWQVRAFNQGSESSKKARMFLEHARARTGNDPALEIRCLRTACHIADWESDAATLSRLATELLEKYVATGDIAGQGIAHQNLALACWPTLDVERGREHLQFALNAFRMVENRSGTAAIILNSGVLAQHLGAFDAAEANYREAHTLADAIGRQPLAGLSKANLASLATFRCDFIAAKALALEALPADATYELYSVAQTALIALGSAERELGEHEQARAHLEEALKLCASRDPRATFDVLVELIPVYAALGNMDKVTECATELESSLNADRSCVTFPAYALGALAIASAANGETARAEALRREAVSLLDELAERIPDEPSRRGYLSLPFHRALRDR